MAITIIKEDGTGLPNSNTVVDVDDFKAYCEQKGYDITAYTDDQIAISVIDSTTNTDMIYAQSYIGTIYKVEQALLWPRSDATGEITGKPFSQPAMPKVLLSQVSERAYRQLTGELSVVSHDYTKERIVESESKSLDGVGSKSQTFADQSSSYTPAQVTQIKTYLGSMMKDILKVQVAAGSIGLVRSL